MGNTERELAEVIGATALEILLLERGGTRIWVPETPPGSQLARIIGDLSTFQMIQYFGPGPMDLPCGTARGQAARRERAMVLLGQGQTAKVVALAVGVSERTVWSYKQQLAGRLSGPKQLDLFDQD